jgi:hypothetical protein
MQPETNPKQEQLRQRIQDSLHRALKYAVGLRKTHTGLAIGGLISSAVATLVAGVTAALGPVVGTGIEGWKLACIVAAALSLISTLCMGIQEQLKFGERVPQGQLCVARLRAIEGALALGSRAWDEVAKEYKEILQGHAEIFGG